jgi:aspartyl-tRNA(Asn)/glutamyl-tRNA(Gln) amidotransferase subunit A
MSVASIGTDTGGSIRIPSAACGCVGLKPAFGELSCDGVVPLAWSLDHVGPIARCVYDARAVYRVMAGVPPAPALADARPDLAGVSFAVPTAYFLDVVDDDVRASFEFARRRLRDAGATVVEVGIPHAGDIGPIYLHTVLAEAAAYHAATLESRPSDYTPPVRVRLEMARYALAEDYARAQRGREVLRAEVTRALAGHAALLLPTLPIPAPRAGATTVQAGKVTDSVRNLTLRLTQAFNLTGHPAISLPFGRSPEGLPHAVQLVGHHGHTESLLGVALAVEAAFEG